jgi:peroxiredoxin
MSMSVTRALALAGATALLACGSSTPAAQAPPQTAGSTEGRTVAPDFTARDVEGKTFRLSDHLGKQVILLDFWSTFCEPCKGEMPHLRAIYDDNKDKGMIIVGVAMDGPESMAEVPAFVRRYSVDFPVILDDDSHIASLYDPKKSMPLSVLIARDGHIIKVREGYNPGEEKLVAADVAEALAGTAAAQ